jgi:hypothetical protein
MRRLLYLFVLIISPATVFAQGYKWEASLKPVAGKGYHKIILSPEVLSKLSNGFYDIRILNDKGQEVPYLLREEKDTSKQIFRQYPILSKDIKPKCCSFYILHNADSQSIHEISLIIRNAEVEKKVRLEGSDDMNSWYVLKDWSTLSAINSTEETSELKIIDFPLSNYKYIRLELNDSASGPLQINSAGYYQHFSESGKFELLPNPVVKQSESTGRTTMVSAGYASPQYADMIELQLSGPPHYLRRARLEARIERSGKAYYETVSSFEINSFTPHIIHLPHPIKADTFRIVIANEDNPPLIAKSVNCWQRRRYLVSYLDSANRYMLKFGNVGLSIPHYDLQYFSDSLAADLPIAVADGIKAIKEAPKKVEEPKTFFTKKGIIWGAIVFIIILLSYVVARMMRDTPDDRYAG